MRLKFSQECFEIPYVLFLAKCKRKLAIWDITFGKVEGCTVEEPRREEEMRLCWKIESVSKWFVDKLLKLLCSSSLPSDPRKGVNRENFDFKGGPNVLRIPFLFFCLRYFQRNLTHRLTIENMKPSIYTQNNRSTDNITKLNILISFCFE